MTEPRRIHVIVTLSGECPNWPEVTEPMVCYGPYTRDEAARELAARDEWEHPHALTLCPDGVAVQAQRSV